MPETRPATRRPPRSRTGRTSRPEQMPASPSRHAPAPPDLFAGGGEMGALMRTHDWSRTPLGPPAEWPESLRTSVDIMLASRYAMFVWWGHELVNLYNDAYRPFLGRKHPQALGQSARHVWAEIWDLIGPRTDAVLARGESTYDEALLLIMERFGYQEETYFTFSYSPIRNERREVSGVFCAVTDETRRVIGERRLKLLREVAATAPEAHAPEPMCAAAAQCMRGNAHDLPFALLYLAESGGRSARLAACVGIEPGAPAAETLIDLESPDAVWPLANAALGREVVVDDLASRFADLPAGAWDRPPGRAVIVPLVEHGPTATAGYLITGLNPYLDFDEEYRGFVGLLAGQIAVGLANARAYQEERRRAEALAEIDRAKTLFFSNVSHEFRTPLTLMLGPLDDALNSGELPDQERDRLTVAHRNSLRLLRLVNGLLDFSRVEAGRIQASYEPMDLAAFTSDLASNFRSACEKGGLNLVIDCPPLPEPVYVDPEMWEKIVLNLVSNAFKFTLDGEIVVRLRSRDGMAELTVRDTGVGIPQDDLPRVFERFHRVEGERGRAHEGTGIGLALAKELVRLHGGELRAESILGAGSVFTISLPLGSAHLPSDRIGAARTLASTATRASAFVEEALRWLPGSDSDAPPREATLPGDVPDGALGKLVADGKPARVLLADDNADMRDYVSRLLTAAGLSVEALGDGQAALAAMRRHPPDLVLADVMMPKLDGFGLLKELRADSDLRTLPVILISARAGEEARLEGIEAGADDYITKPFSARELVARVGSNLQLARVRREADRTLQEEARTLQVLNRVGSVVAAELDLERVVQAVTDAATELTGAAFGAFFYNVVDEHGGRYMLYALSGASRDAFAGFPLPRNTAVFAPTFSGEGLVRSDDILRDPRYGKSDPHFGMPKGHLPVRSYLAAPVVSRSGEVIGGLFFGHPEPGVFTERSERLLTGIAAQAAIAIDNGRLYQAAQLEIAQRKQAEQALREGDERLRHANAQLARHVGELQNANLENQTSRRAALNLMEDAVQSRRAVETLNGELRESERRFREMIDALPAAVYTTDAEGRITHFNPASVELSGRSPEPATDRWCLTWKLYRPDGRPMPHDECPMAIAVKEGRPVRGAEAILERPDGKRIWFTPYPTPLRDRHGQIVGGINMLVDITERKQAEQRQALLTNELAHRGKNLLAVVQGIASRSLSGTRSLAEARDVFTQRIQALARSQTVLATGAFEGAALAEIIRLELEAFSERVEIVGPDLMLNPKAAQMFTLITHELATNATKHGALSRSGGRIKVEWSIRDVEGKPRFRFLWLERGGPAVVPPTRRGFGRTLIEMAVAQEFGARPDMNFAPEGLTYEIDAPLGSVAAAAGTGS